MFNYLRLFLIIAISCIFSSCTEPEEETLITESETPITEPEPPLPTVPFMLSEKWALYEKLIPSTQLAFCRNLVKQTSLETFKFKNWVVEVDTVSRYGNDEYKVKFDTPCTSIETRGKWKVLPDNPMHSQLIKVEKGQLVFISGSYFRAEDDQLVELDYFSIVW
tara:strand:- start:60 stop:551 length:492 start_codon:yes stop_codon:yes gene_type:complete